jgi:hypothetical protein
MLFAVEASAAEYYRSKWFEYPDPLTAPRVTARCVKEASADVPCPTWNRPLRTCRQTVCVGHAYTTELLRVTPTFVISGPDSPDDATRRAVQGIAAGCGVKAIASGQGAAAAAPSPEPTARIAAAIGTAVGVFKACISTVSAAAAAGGIVRQLDFKIETPTHWARV